MMIYLKSTARNFFSKNTHSSSFRYWLMLKRVTIPTYPDSTPTLPHPPIKNVHPSTTTQNKPPPTPTVPHRPPPADPKYTLPNTVKNVFTAPATQNLPFHSLFLTPLTHKIFVPTPSKPIYTPTQSHSPIKCLHTPTFTQSAWFL